MNTLVTSIAVALALVLLTALVAPFVIDWSDHRGFIESQAERLIGGDVEISGDVDVQLLPMPRVVADTVTLNPPGGSGDAAAFGAGRVELAIALTPLLKGEISVERIRLVEPFARLRLEPDGRLDRTAMPDFRLDPERVALVDVEIVAGRVEVLRPAAEPLIITPVNLTADGRSLAGPYRIEGNATYAGVPHAFRLATGRIGEPDGFRLKAAVEPADRPIGIDLDGRIRDADGRPIFSGDVRIERIGLEEDGPLGVWVASGEAMLSANALVYERVSLGLGPEARRVNVNGAATLDFADTPTFSAALNATRMDIDRLFGVEPLESGGFVGLMADIADRAGAEVGGTGTVELAVNSLVAGGNVIEGLGVSLRLGEDGVEISELSAFLPGRTDLTFAGSISGDEGSVEGLLSARATQGQVFLDWMFGETGGAFDWVRDGVEIRTEFEVGARRTRFSDLRLTTDDTDFVATMDVISGAADQSARFDIDLEASALPVAAIDALRRFAAGIDRDGGEAQSRDLDVAIRVDRLTGEGVEAGNVEIVARLLSGDLAIDGLNVGDLGGAQVSASGEIREALTTPDGDIALALSADDLSGVAEVLDALGLDPLAGAISQRATDLVPLAIDATVSGRGAGVELAVTGTAGPSEIALTGQLDGAFGAFLANPVEATLEVSSGNGSTMLRQLGFDVMGDAEPGRFAMTLDGVPEDGMDIDFTIAALNLDASGSGQVGWSNGRRNNLDLRMDVDTQDLRPFLSVFGVGGDMIETALPFAAPIAIGDSDDGLRLAIEDGRLAGRRLALELSRAAEDDAPLTGSVETELIDLTSLLAMSLGLTDGHFGRFTVNEVSWSDRPFVWSLPTTDDIRLSVAADRVALTDLVRVSGATFDLALSPAALRITDLSGEAFGGDLGASLELGSVEDLVSARLQWRLNQAVAEEMVWRRDGRSVISGRLTTTGEVSGQGRSLGALIGTLGGDGSFAIEDGDLRGLSPVAFDEIVAWSDELGEAAQDVDPLRVRDVFASYLDQGAMEFERIDGAFAMNGGVVRAPTILFDGVPYDIRASGRIDLADLTLESQWSLKTASPDDETGQIREAGFVLAGFVTAPERQLDVTPLVNYLKIRAFEREVEKFESFDVDDALGGEPRDEPIEPPEDAVIEPAPAADADVTAAPDEATSTEDAPPSEPEPTASIPPATEDAPPPPAAVPEPEPEPDVATEPEPDIVEVPEPETADDPEPVEATDDPEPDIAPDPADTAAEPEPDPVIAEPIVTEPPPAPDPIQPLEPAITITDPPSAPIDLTPPVLPDPLPPAPPAIVPAPPPQPDISVDIPIIDGGR